MSDQILSHGSNTFVEYPEVRRTKYCKVFSQGFYCTRSSTQANRWATRINGKGIINHYIYRENLNLKILKFNQMTDDTIWNFVNDFLSGDISRKVFWEYARFKHPTNQISFHTLSALNCLEFKISEEVTEND